MLITAEVRTGQAQVPCAPCARAALSGLGASTLSTMSPGARFALALLALGGSVTVGVLVMRHALAR